MPDLKLFQISKSGAQEIVAGSFALERQLQQLIEHNMTEILGVRFLASEYETGKLHAGRIDSLGIDENGSPVIIEYKRTTNENVINQGLFYLDWLMDHQAEFRLLTSERLGADVAATIDWSAPRLLCIANDFTRYDEHAVRQIDRNVELVRYRTFGDELLSIDLVTTVTASSARSRSKASNAGSTSAPTTSKSGTTSVAQLLAQADADLTALYTRFEEFAIRLGDDVVKNERAYYFAFRRLRNFACVEIHPTTRNLLIYLKVDPGTIEPINGFTRDVSKIGHFGTGDLELRVSDDSKWGLVEEWTRRAYEAS